MCIGGRLGAIIDIDGIGEGDSFSRLWSESLGRIIVAVDAEHEMNFIEAMSDADIHLIGMVTETPTLLIEDGYDVLVQGNVADLTKSWKEALDMTGGV